MRRHGDLDSSRYQRCLNKPDKEEVIGQAGEKDVLFLKQLIEEGNAGRSSTGPTRAYAGTSVLGHLHAYQAIAAVVAIIMIEKNA